MALTDLPANTGQFIPPRITGAQASPGATRVMEYVDPVTGQLTGDLNKQVYLFNNTGGATVIGTPYQVRRTGDNTKDPMIVAAATNAVPTNVVVAMEAVADQSWVWCAYTGWVGAALEGTTDIAANDFVGVVQATSVLAFSRIGTAKTAGSHAVAAQAQTTNGVTTPSATNPNKVNLLGSEQTIA